MVYATRRKIATTSADAPKHSGQLPALAAVVPPIAHLLEVGFVQALGQHPIDASIHACGHQLLLFRL
jgi:hypothetical protein